MKKTIYSLTAVAMELSVGMSESFASTGSHAPAGISTLFWPLVNTVLYLGAIIFLYKYKGRGRELLKKAAQQVKEQMAKAKSLIHEAEGIFSAAKQRRQAIEEEKQKILLDFKHEGERLVELLMQKAVDTEVSIKESLERQIANELLQAQKEIRIEVVREAMKITRRRLAQELTAEQDKQLRKDALGHLL